MIKKLTRQGVRDLNDVGSKPKVGHVGRTEVIESETCAHLWEWVHVDNAYFGELDEAQRCMLCGKWR